MTNWEFWPTWIVNFPTGLMWLWFAARARSLFFFTTVNPAIETGGVMGESKIDILDQIPASALPKTIFVEKDKATFLSIIGSVENSNIGYPLIAKPDIGERGFLVSKIETKEQLEDYFNTITVDFLIQEFVKFPLEISVLYHRMPDAKKGAITSLCLKKTLTVTGNGTDTIEQLMSDYPRAVLQIDRFRTDFPELLALVPARDEEVELEPIGNHSRGTTFLNRNSLVDEKLVDVFDRISHQMEGVFYGRFDLKCESFDKLKRGTDFSILEFNGIASEPSHIYDPQYSIFKAYQDLWKHWKIIYAISNFQRGKGVEAMSVNEFWIALKKYYLYMKGV